MDSKFVLEESIFTNARRIADSDAREHYIRDACGADTELQVRIRLLLRVLVEENSFLESPVETTAAIDLLYGEAEEVGSSIGPYELVEQIGSGGMGLVFLARQNSPVRRMVALKIIRPGMDSRELVRQFESERQTLAQLNHPGITRLLDAGTTDSGRPWFVMELAPGLPITDFCKQRAAAIPERLRLFEAVCSALHHAHQNGVIHRDIKPANVVVTEVDGQPVPKVIDFGIASVRGHSTDEKSTETTPQIRSRPKSIMGTPAYMSPEQTTLPDHDVDERCDVYSLGMLLYQLLTDSRPFPEISWQEIGFTETRRIIQIVSPWVPSERVLDRVKSGLEASADPAGDRPTTTAARSRTESQRLSSQLQGDLDWITMKAIEKDRSQRYQSVADLAADIRRYLHHEPVQAGPPLGVYRLKKLWRRKKSRVLVMTLTTFVLILAGVSVLTARMSLSQRKAVVEHTAQLDILRAQRQRQSSIAALHAGFEEYFRGRVDIAREKLQLLESSTGETLERGFAGRYLEQLCRTPQRVLKGTGGRVFNVPFSPDSRMLVTCSGDTRCALDIWDVANGQVVRSISGFDDDVNSAIFSHDGSKLITAEEARMIRVWDVLSGTELSRLEGFEQPVVAMYLAKDQRTVVISEVEWKSKLAVTWVCDLQDPTHRIQIPGQFPLGFDEERGIFAVVSDAGEVSVRNYPRFSAEGSLLGLQPRTVCGSLSHDGQLLATGSMDGNTHIRRLSDSTSEKLPRNAPVPPHIRSLAFSIDDKFLIEVTSTGFVHIWETSTRTLQKVFLAGIGETWSCAVSPDGRWLAVGCSDGITEIYAWSAITGVRRSVLQFEQTISDAAVDVRTRDFAVLDATGHVRIYSSDDDQLLQSILVPADVAFRNLTFSHDGEYLWMTDESGNVKKVRRVTSEIVQSFPTYGVRIMAPVVSPDGRFLGVSTFNADSNAGSVCSGVWDTKTGKEVFRLPDKLTPSVLMPHRVNEFLNTSIAVTTQQNIVSRWNPATGAEILPRLEDPKGWIFHTSAAPDGKSLLLGLRDATVVLWDPDTNEFTYELRGLRSTLNATEYSRNGTTLVTATQAGEVRLWDLPTGHLICELPGAAGPISDIWFSKDERRLLALVNKPGGGSEVYVWDAGESE
ncbi:MAG: protein kinase [Planctomycetaceae bacterium]|nr:protein kinase [Planctomycetaceae bacterium]